MGAVRRLPVVTAVLLLAACSGSDVSSPSKVDDAPPSASTLVVTSTTADTTSSSSTTSWTGVTSATPPPGTPRPYTEEFTKPISINERSEVLLEITSTTQYGPELWTTTVTPMIVDTRNSSSRRMPTPDPQTWPIGLNDAGLVAANVDLDEGTPTCEGVPEPCPAYDVLVWDSVSGEMHRLEGYRGLAGPNEAGLVVVIFDPDGMFSYGGREQMAVWDPATDQLTELAVPEGAAAFPPAAAFINDRGQIAAQVGHPLTLALWDAESGTVEQFDAPMDDVAPTFVPADSWQPPEFDVLYGLDDTGRVVTCQSGNFDGCSVWQPEDGLWQRLREADGRFGHGSLTGVSGSGLVAGSSSEPPGPDGPPGCHVEVWDLDAGPRSTRIDSDGGCSMSPIDINDAGQIIADDHRGGPELYEPATGSWTEVAYNGLESLR